MSVDQITILRRAQMQALRNPEVVQFHLPIEFLEYLLEEQKPTTLIICSTRDVFLQDLLALTRATRATSTPNPIEDIPDEERHEHAAEEESREAPIHPLLVPTIHLIAISKSMRLVFCQTLQHLRAFLSVFRSSEHHQPTDLSATAEKYRPFLAILNLINLHRDTTELSAQGLSRTFALAVDLAARERLNLIICETGGMDGQDDMFTGGGHWEAEVPLFNGTVRMGEGDREWAGKMVKVKRVAQRWFDFKMNEDKVPLTDAVDI